MRQCERKQGRPLAEQSGEVTPVGVQWLLNQAGREREQGMLVLGACQVEQPGSEAGVLIVNETGFREGGPAVGRRQTGVDSCPKTGWWIGNGADWQAQTQTNQVCYRTRSCALFTFHKFRRRDAVIFFKTSRELGVVVKTREVSNFRDFMGSFF